MNRKCFFVLILILGLFWLYGNEILVVRFVETEQTIKEQPAYAVVKNADLEENDAIDLPDEVCK
jgi:hypothetical protein